jgi:hypothetical protein
MYSLTVFKSELLHKICKTCARKKGLRSFAKIFACFPLDEWRRWVPLIQLDMTGNPKLISYTL